VRAYAKANDLKLGKIAQPLRAALTGRVVSPPIFDVIAILEKDEALARLDDASAI
jgi:glutamyl-tRNA synthetase